MNKTMNNTALHSRKRFTNRLGEEVSHEEAQETIKAPEHHKSSFTADLKWIASLSLLMSSVLTAPQWLWSLELRNDPTTPVEVGVVQRVHFIGNLGIDSQIDTEDMSFMVQGVTRFRKGMRLEQHKSFFDLELCDVETQHCEYRMGYR